MSHQFARGGAGACKIGLYCAASLFSLIMPALLPAPAAAEGVAPGKTALSEITVTASRRKQSVQKAALAISVISGKDLAREGVTQAKDLSAVVPGLQVGAAGSATQVYIRGIGNDAANGLAEGAVAFNVDGVYIARPTAIDSAFFDVNRIEVLKGPQGTLYGKNATGGAINVITNDPVLGRFGGFESIELGDYGLVSNTGSLNVPVNDKMALRFAYNYVRHDGYLADGSDAADNVAGRAKALIKPIDDLTITLSADYSQQSGRGSGATVVPALDSKNPWIGSANALTNEQIANSPLGGLGFGFLGPYGLLAPVLPNNYVNNRQWGLSSDIEWDLGFATLSSVTGFRKDPSNYLTYDAGFSFQNIESDRQVSQELRLAHQDDRIKWVAGLYYFNENQGLFLANYEGPIGIGYSNTPLLTDRSYAGFGEVTYTVLPGLRVIAGDRYTHEDKAVAGVDVDVENAADTFAFSHTLAENADNWKGGVEYDLLPQSMLYGTVGTGFKSGGFYPNEGADSYGPEKLTAFELGSKNRFLDNRLEANIELFDWIYKDRQYSHLGYVTTPTGSPLGFLTYGTYNAGKATLRGADFNTKYVVTDNDRFILEAEYNDTDYNDFVYTQPYGYASPGSNGCILGPNVKGNQTINCDGKPLSRAPKWAGSVGWQHTFDLGDRGSVEADVTTHFSSSYYLDIDYISQELASGYTRTDFDVTYRPDVGDWSLTGYVHNLENSAVYTGATQQPFVPGLVFAHILPPRTFGARFTIGF